ncbi:hypothetical protein V0M98_39395 (plasmid) [Pseudomonas silesiensis]|uniref:hypothetical protein n=1 Tax=Pseudomonas silesiensis TaxID=1853130 RepID=UPI0030D30343
MADKSVIEELAKLLKPVAESLAGIDRSLALLADLQLATEFEPDAEKRNEIYAQIDAAREADDAAYDVLMKAQEARQVVSSLGYDQLVKAGRADEAQELAGPITAAMNGRLATSKHFTNLQDAFPALARIHRRRQA